MALSLSIIGSTAALFRGLAANVSIEKKEKKGHSKFFGTHNQREKLWKHVCVQLQCWSNCNCGNSSVDGKVDFARVMIPLLIHAKE